MSGVAGNVQRDRGRRDRIDRDIILHDAFELKLDVRSNARLYADVAKPGEIAFHSGEGKSCVLIEIDARTDLKGTGWRDVDVIGEQRPLLRRDAKSRSEQKDTKDDGRSHAKYFDTHPLKFAIALVPKMPDAGEHHRDAVFIGGFDGFSVFDRTPGLNDS